MSHFNSDSHAENAEKKRREQLLEEKRISFARASRLRYKSSSLDHALVKEIVHLFSSSISMILLSPLADFWNPSWSWVWRKQAPNFFLGVPKRSASSKGNNSTQTQ